SPYERASFSVMNENGGEGCSHVKLLLRECSWIDIVLRSQCPPEHVCARADAVLRQRIRPTSTGSQAAVLIVEIQVDFITCTQLDGVTRCREVFGTIPAYRELTRLRWSCFEHDFTIVESQPPHIRMVAVLLRQDVRDVLLIYRRRITPA